MSTTKSPIAIFVYIRLHHTRRMLEALMRNNGIDDHEIYIFSDGSKSSNDYNNVKDVRNYLKEFQNKYKCNLIFRENNYGLSKNIIEGISYVLNIFESVICLEDDIITSESFLLFMQNCLDYYKNYPTVFSISGYNHPKRLMKIKANYPYDVYFCNRNSSWGWATWKNRWDRAEWDINENDEFLNSNYLHKSFNRCGDDLTNMFLSHYNKKIDSWAVRWSYVHFKYSAIAVYPVNSFVQNIGLDGTGVHSGTTSLYNNHMLNTDVDFKLSDYIIIDKNIMKSFRRVFGKTNIYDIINYISRKIIKCNIFR